MTKTAEQRADELFREVKVKDLPPVAREFLMAYSEVYGGCGEVALSAYRRYAMLIEELPAARDDEARYGDDLPESLKCYLKRPLSHKKTVSVRHIGQASSTHVNNARTHE